MWVTEENQSNTKNNNNFLKDGGVEVKNVIIETKTQEKVVR